MKIYMLLLLTSMFACDQFKSGDTIIETVSLTEGSKFADVTVTFNQPPTGLYLINGELQNDSIALWGGPDWHLSGKQLIITAGVCR